MKRFKELKIFKVMQSNKLLRSILILTLIGLVIVVIGLILLWVFMPEGATISDSISSLGIDFERLLQYGYPGLFLITLIAGTFIPMGSPIAIGMAGMLGMEKIPTVFCAGFGYTIGIHIDYFLAKLLGEPFVIKRVSEETYNEITNWWNKWGFALLIIFAIWPGSPLDLVALICGLFRFRLCYFTPIVLFNSFWGSYFFVYIGLSVASIFGW
ncbi:MAG: hypothetical protein EF806_04200 [Candidatus Methanoliparum thermophilum]|uniref:VTT domain-containing protein n=1 Tax=Methanoliparum thermophilum TaxID=2491083 RepID=A0A520KRZ2_METT2|nr:VTT domain-containing protein [Candidatus Methanoliparum sp. LAM-1]RZN64549.1 MAG: hypothetical protein EF806_04200 [Candidatus Methanoliparum thermophilum]